MRSYGQYCPVARASEVLAERWTPLVIRNLMFGADTFTAIARGVPQMSRSVLVTRLGELERSGLLTTESKTAGRGGRYRLTEAGRDLASVIDALATWGDRWVELGPQERRALGLDNAARDDPQRSYLWTQMAGKRGQAMQLIPREESQSRRKLLQGALLYSRECKDRSLSEDERKAKDRCKSACHAAHSTMKPAAAGGRIWR